MHVFYTTGCDVTLTGNTGYIFTPGYPQNINYPNNQVCTWTIDADEPIALYFHTNLALQDEAEGLTDNSDYVQVSLSCHIHPLASKGLHSNCNLNAFPNPDRRSSVRRMAKKPSQ